MILNMTGGAGGSGKSEIIVTAPAGSTVTVQRGDETPKAAAEVNGVWTFKGCGVGSWVVHAVSADEVFRKDVPVDITEEGQLVRYKVSIVFELVMFDASKEINRFTDGFYVYSSKAGSSVDSQDRLLITDEYIRVTTEGNTSSADTVRIHGRNEIDMSQYSQLIVDCNYEKTPLTDGRNQVRIVDNWNPSNQNSLGNVISETTGRQTLVMDISQINTNAHFAIQVQSNTNAIINNLYVYSIKFIS